TSHAPAHDTPIVTRFLPCVNLYRPATDQQWKLGRWVTISLQDRWRPTSLHWRSPAMSSNGSMQHLASKPQRGMAVQLGRQGASAVRRHIAWEDRALWESELDLARCAIVIER